MSQHSAPNYRATNKYTLPPIPNSIRRPRTFTYPSNPDDVPLVNSKHIQPTFNHYKDDKPHDVSNQLRRKQSQFSEFGSCFSDPKSSLQAITRKDSTDNENGNEKWKKLKQMVEQVNNMKQIADQLFPSVNVKPINTLKACYSGCSEFEYQVELLRNVIQEQISRMKAFWCEEDCMSRNSSISSEDHRHIEQMRYNLRDMFSRMKVVVDELIPPENSKQKQTKSWVEDLKCQLMDLEASIKGFVKSISCDSFQSQMNSPLSDSMSESYTVLRIKEMEDELEASSKREDELRLKLKELEARNEKEIEKMDEQIQELQQMLNRANTRAKKSSDEAYGLRYKLTQLEIEANQKQLEIGLSERTIRRGDQVRSRAGYTRTSPEHINRYTVDAGEHSGEYEVKRSPVPTISRKENIYDQPKPIPVSSLKRMSSFRERRNPVLSQGSRLVSPKEIKYHNNPWSSVPESGYHYNNTEMNITNY